MCHAWCPFSFTFLPSVCFLNVRGILPPNQLNMQHADEVETFKTWSTRKASFYHYNRWPWLVSCRTNERKRSLWKVFDKLPAKAIETDSGFFSCDGMQCMQRIRKSKYKWKINIFDGEQVQSSVFFFCIPRHMTLDLRLFSSFLEVYCDFIGFLHVICSEAEQILWHCLQQTVFGNKLSLRQFRARPPFLCSYFWN